MELLRNLREALGLYTRAEVELAKTAAYIDGQAMADLSSRPPKRYAIVHPFWRDVKATIELQDTTVAPVHSCKLIDLHTGEIRDADWPKPDPEDIRTIDID